MVPEKIKTGVERSPLIAKVPGLPVPGGDWKNLTRTVFDRVAKKINQEVTRRAVLDPNLVKEFLLFGENEFRNICFRNGISSMDEFVETLKVKSPEKPYIWISGKTLQWYWNDGSAKDKKLNVLLTFLGANQEAWDDWKTMDTMASAMKPRLDNGTLYLLRKHFVGHYYRYFQKSDGSPVVVKAPLVIREHHTEIVTVETKTIGHRYKSTYMVIRDGALYIECENLDWNEKETYIFNIGFEINPQVVTGVSNTLSRKGQAIALKNVLVRQTRGYNYLTTDGLEIPYESRLDPSSDDFKVLSFFKKNTGNVIHTNYCYSVNELA